MEDNFCSPSLRVCFTFAVHKENPYSVTVTTAEFFACGFLKDTQIVVADSLVDEVTSHY